MHAHACYLGHAFAYHCVYVLLGTLDAANDFDAQHFDQISVA